MAIDYEAMLRELTRYLLQLTATIHKLSILIQALGLHLKQQITITSNNPMVLYPKRHAVYIKSRMPSL